MDKFIKEYGIKKSRNQGKKQVASALDQVIEQKWEDALAHDQWLQDEEDWAYSNMTQEWENEKNRLDAKEHQLNAQLESEWD